MAKSKRARNGNGNGVGSKVLGDGNLKISRFTHLEAAVQAKQREVAIREQHGEVRVIVKDGKPVS